MRLQPFIEKRKRYIVDKFQKAKKHFLDGIKHLESDAFEDAEREFLNSLELAPNRPSTLTNLGATEIKLKKYHQAISTCELAISMDENNPEALLNLGLAKKGLQDLSTALDCFNRAIMLDPRYAKAWSNKGGILRELCQYENALDAFDQAVHFDKNYFEAWSNRGLALYDLKHYQESLQSQEMAISINRHYVDAWFNKGLTYIALRDFVSALNCFHTAFGINPHHKYILGDLIHTQLLIGDWNNLDEKIEDLEKEIGCGLNASTPFSILSAIDEPQLHLETAKFWIDDKYPYNKSLPVIRKKLHSKIRIGYFSPDFKDHPISLLTSELFELHDRNQFEIIAFSLQAADPKNSVRKRLVAAFDQFIEVEKKSDLEIAQLARDYEIDIAIDLCGHTQFARTGIFSYRSAPIQVNWLGYPGTLGADYFDYIIADPTLITKSDQQFYSEKIVYLPNSYMVDDSRRLASGKSFGRAELNLPENKFIFCCFNNSYKFNGITLDSWARILSKVPNSALWISENNPAFRRNLLTEFSNRGIYSSRIIFAEKMDVMGDHLARYKVADLFLDTLPFNAHTTAIDALKSGVPVLTLLGKSFAGRVGASLLNAVDLTELITNSRNQYEAIAIELGNNPDKLHSLKKKLSKNLISKPLFNTQLFTQHIESAFLKMHERYLRGLPPDHLHIKGINGGQRSRF